LPSLLPSLNVAGSSASNRLRPFCDQFAVTKGRRPFGRPPRLSRKIFGRSTENFAASAFSSKKSRTCAAALWKSLFSFFFSPLWRVRKVSAVTTFSDGKGRSLEGVLKNLTEFVPFLFPVCHLLLLRIALGVSSRGCQGLGAAAGAVLFFSYQTRPSAESTRRRARITFFFPSIFLRCPSALA